MFDFIAISGIAAVVFGLLGQIQRTHRRLIAMAGVSMTSWAIHFALKGASTAAVMAVIMTGRILLGLFSVHWKAPSRLALTAALEIVVVLGAYMSWQGWTSIPPLLASMVLTYATLNLPYERLRPGLMLGEFFWFINGVVVGSPLAMVAAGLAVAINGGILAKQSRSRQKAGDADAPKAGWAPL